MKILCVHGWAFSPWMWQPMNTLLLETAKAPLEFVCADLGFDGQVTSPTGHFDLAIGHSLGVLWLLDNPGLSFDRLVSINGFTQFYESSEVPSGCPQAVVENMRSRLKSEKDRLLTDFFNNAGVTEIMRQRGLIHRASDTERLDSALADLIRIDGREQWNHYDGPRRVIAATGDRIVRMEHTQACFADEDTRWVESDCHCLPVKFPEVCAAVIRELIEAR